MKQTNTIQENIKFLINAYKMQLEKDFNLSIEEKELIECYIIELETILKLSK